MGIRVFLIIEFFVFNIFGKLLIKLLSKEAFLCILKFIQKNPYFVLKNILNIIFHVFFKEISIIKKIPIKKK